MENEREGLRRTGKQKAEGKAEDELESIKWVERLESNRNAKVEGKAEDKLESIK